MRIPSQDYVRCRSGFSTLYALIVATAEDFPPRNFQNWVCGRFLVGFVHSRYQKRAILSGTRLSAVCGAVANSFHVLTKHQMRNIFLRSTFPIFIVLLSSSFLFGDVVTWSGSSGQLPSDIDYELLNSSDSEVPILSGGVLTLSNDDPSEIMAYRMSGSDLSFGSTTEVSFRMRYDSGSDLVNFRTGMGVAITTASAVGLTMYFGQDEVFLTNSDGSRGIANTRSIPMVVFTIT